ncbi:hypothetical protein [Duganella sp. S19_KUP01_CR8]|uniref:hypothetical protein n=1 Tax=Duganella sp. S19_KUP01_CR8 TaxID=3025502 RepID=UPI002FCDB92D
MQRYPPDLREQGPGSVSREISDGVARRRRRQTGGAGAYIKKVACAFGGKLLCAFFFVSVLFIVKSDSKRMTIIEYTFHNRDSTIHAMGMASRTLEPSY